jgi:hypothetical protein
VKERDKCLQEKRKKGGQGPRNWCKSCGEHNKVFGNSDSGPGQDIYMRGIGYLKVHGKEIVRKEFDKYLLNAKTQQNPMNAWRRKT